VPVTRATQESEILRIKMIARVSILLPFDLLIREGDNLPTLELTTSDYRINFHPPVHFADRTKMTDGALDSVTLLREARVPAFSDNLLADGRRVAQVNVLILDFSKPEFDRAVSESQTRPVDPDIEFVFAIANEILAKLRVYSRAFQIKELVPGHDPCTTRYLTDAGQELEKEEGKIRGSTHGHVTVGFPVLTPDALGMIALTDSTEPYVWDQLLLDAYELLPDVGGAIAMAAAALETFIVWALDIVHQERPLPPGLWEWIKIRNNDHTKEPSVAEKFDVLLRAFTGHSLKDEAQLWRYQKELRAARNALVHKGLAMVGTSRMDARKARELVGGADKIIRWVELLLPAAQRRARTEAIGPFTRRLASQPTEVAELRMEADAQNRGPVRVLRADKPAEDEYAVDRMIGEGCPNVA
jgi:hypothetical protein